MIDDQGAEIVFFPNASSSWLSFGHLGISFPCVGQRAVEFKNPSPTLRPEKKMSDVELLMRNARLRDEIECSTSPSGHSDDVEVVQEAKNMVAPV